MYDILKGQTYQIIIVVEFLALFLWIGIVSPHAIGGELKTPYGEYVFRIISITCSTTFLLCSLISIIVCSKADNEYIKGCWASSFTIGIIFFLISLYTFIVAIKGIYCSH